MSAVEEALDMTNGSTRGPFTAVLDEKINSLIRLLAYERSEREKIEKVSADRITALEAKAEKLEAKADKYDEVIANGRGAFLLVLGVGGIITFFFSVWPHVQKLFSNH